MDWAVGRAPVESLSNIFVYGTLKRGQCREHCWPLRPVMTRSAWTYGRLYDLGEYPAMLPGNHRVAGQVWSYHKADSQQVLEALDRIEGTNQPGQANEYDRTEILVTIRQTALRVSAFTYIYARPIFLERYGRQIDGSMEVAGMPYVIWPTKCLWD
jgi:gamma-glutamylcyclotransferase (GGCT)/AIG2-like uncharacterized protein YtfP